MKLIEYTNSRTGRHLKGASVHDDGTLTLAPDNPHQAPDLVLGDVLALVFDPNQKYFTVGVDKSGMALRVALQHVKVSTQLITGKATVTRQTTEADSFGRSTATLVTVVTDTSAALVDSREVYPDPAPAGGPQLIFRHELLVASDVPLGTGDQLTYATGGSSQEYRVVGSVPAGPGLWRVYSVD